MSSLEEANRFVNCVMNRTRNDTLMHGTLILLLALVPILALLFGFIMLWHKGGDYGELRSFLTYTSIAFLFYSLMLILFFLYRRLIDHSVRDNEWRSSLIAYARECGCNTERLMSLDGEARRKERTVAEKPAILLIIVMFLAFMVFGGFPNKFGISTDDGINLAAVVVIGVIELVLMFFLVITYLIKVPYVHEASQIEFVKGFSSVMRGKGLSIPAFPAAVKNINAALSVILFFITFGLFLLVILYKTFDNTNIHLMNQWEYEVKLMDIIVTNEGGTGIMPNNLIEAGNQ